MSLIRNVLDDWGAKEVSWCHWKSTNHLKETFASITDIDVLVSPRHRVLCEKVLNDYNFAEMDTAHFRSYPAIKDFVCYDEDLGWVHFHLHYQLNLGDRWSKNYHFPFEEGILTNRIWDTEYKTYTINPQDELMLFIVRMSLKFRNPTNSSSIRKEFSFLVDRIRCYGPEGSCIPYFSSTYTTLVLPNLNADIGKVFSLMKRQYIGNFISDFRRFKVFRFYVNIFIRCLYRYIVEFSRRKLNVSSFGRRRIQTGGKLVVFVGTDGAGKTSRIAAATNTFSKQINAKSIFLGNGSSGAGHFRKLIFSIYGRRRYTSSLHKVEGSSSVLKSMLIHLWQLVCLLEREKFLKHMLIARGAGSLVLVDRWPEYNLQITDGPRLANRTASNFLERYVQQREKQFFDKISHIRPDLFIKLIITPEVALYRKPNEFSREYAEAANDEIRLRTTNANHYLTLDASDTESKLDAEISKNIWSVVAT